MLHAIRNTVFTGKAFDEQATALRYRTDAGMRQFEQLNTEKSPFPNAPAWVVAGIAPFYLILERLLSSSFGVNGVLFFLAVLGMPVSLWFAGLLMRLFS